MKKITLLLLPFYLFTLNLNAQNLIISTGGTAQGTSIFYDETRILPGFFVELESDLNKHISIFGKSDFLFKSTIVATNTIEKIKSFGLQTGLRIYSKNGSKKFFFGPQLSYSSFNEFLKIDDIKAPNPIKHFPSSVFGLGINLGFQARPNEKISFRIQSFLDFVGTPDDIGYGDAVYIKYGISAGLGYRLY